MRRIVSAALIGLIFGAGIALAGMGNPAKVLNFFDPFGSWDASLLLVMVSALVVTLVGYRLTFKRSGPIFGGVFHLPTKRDLDASLLGGSALFGIGWGIAGFCPGGAIPALGLGQPSAILFVAAMTVGIALATILRRSAAGSPAFALNPNKS